MKLSKRFLAFLNIVLLSLVVLFVYGYMNGVISYKYEVQADEFAGNILNGHQREILDYVSSNETRAFICFVFFMITFITKIYTPGFRGKIIYVK